MKVIWPGVKLSIILLDWSVRESFHILNYLNQQSYYRSEYEVIWIEYYSRKMWFPKPPDVVINLDYPRNVTYHKHEMYNRGILAAKGEIVCIVDSDAALTNHFVREIFAMTAPNTVLHLDEVRNHNRLYYPFKFPSIDLLKEPPSNWIQTKNTTRGMAAADDLIHLRNYGACMAARKSDLIRIGGADEHEDYRGYICGPYDMTFRLVNAGVKEVWHTGEFIYHAWHPNQDGKGILSQFGPHDGRHMSRRALSNIQSKRILPFKENEAIKECRLSSQTQTTAA